MWCLDGFGRLGRHESGGTQQKCRGCDVLYFFHLVLYWLGCIELISSPRDKNMGCNPASERNAAIRPPFSIPLRLGSGFGIALELANTGRVPQ